MGNFGRVSSICCLINSKTSLPYRQNRHCRRCTWSPPYCYSVWTLSWHVSSTDEFFSTNNWSDYGGMDVYVNQIVGSGSAHDLFYTNTAVKVFLFAFQWYSRPLIKNCRQTAYKNYIKTFVGRYSSNPIILGWELGNNPDTSENIDG